MLDFDHVRGDKVKELSVLVSQGVSVRKLDAEIAKCVVVCANCHRRRTAIRQGSWRELAVHGEEFTARLERPVRRNLLYVREYLEARGCERCGEADLRVLEFDHVDEKRFCVMTGVWEGYSLDRIREEIERCRVLCANCHRARTAQQAQPFRYWALLAADVAGM